MLQISEKTFKLQLKSSHHLLTVNFALSFMSASFNYALEK
jgi:hypothetical protein